MRATPGTWGRPWRLLPWRLLRQPWLLALVLPLVLAACQPADSPAGSSQETGALVLSSALTSGCERGRAGGMDEAGLAVGSMAVEFTLKDTDGIEHSLSGLLAEKPVVMVFGSFT